MESAVRLDNINEIIEFCLNEIALEGLEGSGTIYFGLLNLKFIIRIVFFSQ